MTSQVGSKDSQIANLTTQVNNLQVSNNSYSSQINQFNSNRNGYYIENDNGGYCKTYRLTNYTGSLRASAGINFGTCGIVLTGGGEVNATLDLTFTPSW